MWVMYENGNYDVHLSLSDGTKVRMTKDDEFVPSRPESMDVKITNRCDRGCPWCHEDSRPDGANADIDAPWLDTLPPYTEIAVGGGNVLEHPDLVRFLGHLRDLRCVPSITLNQEHFLANAGFVGDLFARGLVYGIGVSLTDPTDELIGTMRRFPTSVLHTIAGVLTEDDVGALSGNGLKLLILGYKDTRRGKAYHSGRHGGDVDANMGWLAGHLDAVMAPGAFKVCSFDNLALGQLPVRDYLGEDRWRTFYMGDDGSFTFYIDMVDGVYSTSSTDVAGRTGIGDRSVIDMFRDVRSRREG